MEKLRERMSYLHGMADGLGISNQSKEGRIVIELMHVMEEMVAKLDTMDNRIEEQDEYLEAVDEDLADLEEYVGAIDEDLDDVEDFLFLEDDDDELIIELDDDDDEFTARALSRRQRLHGDLAVGDNIIVVDGTYDEMEGYDDDDLGYFEMECPNCQELVSIDQDVFDDDMIAEVLCPDCHEVILVNDDVQEENEFDYYVTD
ncbi:hypothetical protein BEP19_01085 [Ammoniphilus oxalaticus]|uniref:AraC family transcriptional regulator n=1 Tax=Ammoniphilus oxalaticus TaxID=66863 RepID=A0A419SMP7_9BACL|nr:CD1247 N-terminal domain-containing protein [Ammoniphilus oxalaticus]RKD25568.1 hypothetical protein BEP19_01085 [Ammoniphilus oxalaticus]